MIDYEQMVQDVLDGKQNPVTAKQMMFEKLVELNKCIEKVEEYINEMEKRYV